MIDRESILADDAILAEIREQFVPVAIDQFYTTRQKDPEGEFYRGLVAQGPRTDPKATTQGFYLASPEGTLLGYNNNRDPERFRGFMKEALGKFDSGAAAKATRVDGKDLDRGQAYAFPEGGMKAVVHAKVMGGYDEGDEKPSWKYRSIMQEAVSTDHFWATAEEQAALAAGVVPQTVARRIARYHLIDNTRGEPNMWKEDEIVSVEMAIVDGLLTGEASMKRKDGKSGYRAVLRGHLESTGERLTRFDLVARGSYWGEGTYTRGAPKGEFPLAVSFRLAPDADQRVVPQGSKGWVDGYWKP